MKPEDSSACFGIPWDCGILPIAMLNNTLTGAEVQAGCKASQQLNVPHKLLPDALRDFSFHNHPHNHHSKDEQRVTPAVQTPARSLGLDCPLQHHCFCPRGNTVLEITPREHKQLKGRRWLSFCTVINALTVSFPCTPRLSAGMTPCWDAPMPCLHGLLPHTSFPTLVFSLPATQTHY